MKIGLYFGSFNPIHNGHCIIANYVAQNTTLNQVWLIVSPHNPLKKKSTLLNEYARLHLAKIAIENERNLRVSDIEFNLTKPSYTIDTLIYLKEKYPQHTFSIIMGSDSFQNIQNWKNYDTLLKDYEIYIFNRPGNIITENNKNTIHVLDAPLIEISSTDIRKMIQEKKSITYWVHDKVKEEIEKSNYYK